MNKLITILLLIFTSSLLSQAINEENATSVILNTEIETSDNAITIVSPTLSGSRTITLPNSSGNNGEILVTDGNGTTTWTSVSSSGNPGGVDGSIQFNESGNFGGSSTFIYDDINDRVGIGVTNPLETLHINSSMRIGNDGTDGEIYFASSGSSNFIIFRTDNAMSGTQIQIYTLPVDDGNTNQGIITDGNGQLSWGGDIKNGPVTNNSPNNNNITNNPDNAYLGGGSNNEINNNGENIVVFGGDDNAINNASDGSGIIGGSNNEINNLQGATAILGGNDNGVNNNMNSSVVANGSNNEMNNDANYAFLGAGQSNGMNNNSDHSVIFAGFDNEFNNDANWAIIGTGFSNAITGDYCGILTGRDNDINSNSAERNVLFSGNTNSISGGVNSFIGGGINNRISDDNSSILSGDNVRYSNANNHTNSLYGQNIQNTNQASYIIMGGRDITISNNNTDFTIAFGRQISASNDEGNILLGDDNTGTLNSGNDHEWRCRFAGGYRLWTNAAANVGVGINAGGNSWNSVSDSNKKSLKIKLNPIEYYNKIKELEIYSWSYKDSDSDTRNYSPMAQEFYRLFGKDQYGRFGTDTTIKELDLVSIFALGVQGAAIKQEEKNLTLDKLSKDTQANSKKIDELEARLKKLKAKLED